MSEREYAWTLPLGQGDLALLTLPDRLLSSRQWDQMMRLLDVMKPGLVRSKPVGARFVEAGLGL